MILISFRYFTSFFYHSNQDADIWETIYKNCKVNNFFFFQIIQKTSLILPICYPWMNVTIIRKKEKYTLIYYYQNTFYYNDDEKSEHTITVAASLSLSMIFTSNLE